MFGSICFNYHFILHVLLRLTFSVISVMQIYFSSKSFPILFFPSPNPSFSLRWLVLLNRIGIHKMHHKLQPSYVVLLPFFLELFSSIKPGTWGVLPPPRARSLFGPQNAPVQTQIPTSSRTNKNLKSSITGQSFPIQIHPPNTLFR